MPFLQRSYGGMETEQIKGKNVPKRAGKKTSQSGVGVVCVACGCCSGPWWRDGAHCGSGGPLICFRPWINKCENLGSSHLHSKVNRDAD